MLAQDEEWWVRCKVTKNESTSADVLAMLAKDEDIDVRCAVVENKNTSVETLVFLSKDNNEWVSKVANDALKERKEKSKTSMER